MSDRQVNLDRDMNTQKASRCTPQQCYKAQKSMSFAHSSAFVLDFLSTPDPPPDPELCSQFSHDRERDLLAFHPEFTQLTQSIEKHKTHSMWGSGRVETRQFASIVHPFYDTVRSSLFGWKNNTRETLGLEERAVLLTYTGSVEDDNFRIVTNQKRRY